MGHHTLISRTGRIFTVVLGAVLALALVQSTHWVRDLSASICLLALSTLVLWRPRATLSPEGIAITNPLKRHKVPWNAIRLIDTRLVLTLHLERETIPVHAGVGPGRHTTLLASRDRGLHLPESSYHSGTIRPGDLVGTESGDVAAIARRFWEAYRNDPENSVVQTRWDGKGWALLVLAIVAATATAVLSL